MSILGDPVVLVNRTSKPLTFKADGRDYVLKPGENQGYNTGHAEFAFKQHPVAGTADYGSVGGFVSKIGILNEQGEELQPCSELPDDWLREMGEREYFDPETLPENAKGGRYREKGRYRRPDRSLATANSLAVANA